MKSRTPIAATFALLALTGCDSKSVEDRAEPDARILAAYYGLDQLPAPIVAWCPPSAVGQDGMPVTFSVRLDDATVSPDRFVVETATGERVTPVCATLSPAVEPLELRTVLLAGPFGTPSAQPRSVRVVGALRDVDGNSVEGLEATTTRLEDGPELVLAERYDPGTPGLNGECPAQTGQVVQLVFGGGVTGPDRAQLGEPQLQSVSITLENGQQVSPIALADDDPDNFVHACVAESSPAARVTIAAGHFHDPGDDANPATSIEVVEGRE
jgi:hypothetical protein